MRKAEGSRKCSRNHDYHVCAHRCGFNDYSGNLCRKHHECDNANLPFLFVGIACVVNIMGDLLFVAMWGMDAAGAALATVLAQLVSLLFWFCAVRNCRFLFP